MSNTNDLEDYGLELSKAISYVDFVRDNLETGLSNANVETFSWMLADAGDIIYKLNKSVYPSEEK